MMYCDNGRWIPASSMAQVIAAVWMLLVLLAAVPVSAQTGEESDAVTDYETRLEEISREVSDIRGELEQLVEELVEPELARVFLFLGTAPRRVQQGGVTVSVDGKTVFSRPFTPAEQDVLQRGLLLELVDLHLPAGEHRVSLHELGEEPPEPARFTVERGAVVSWIGQISESGVEWLVE